MTQPMNQHDIALVLAHLDAHRAQAPNELLAIHATVCAHIPGAKDLSYDQRWELVRGVNLEIASRKLKAHCQAGKPIRTSAGTVQPKAQAPSSQKPTLDVRGFAGANKTMKLMSYVRSQAGSATVTHEAAHRKASELASSCEVLA